MVAFGAIAARRWQQIGPFVSGIDPGNWLAFGRQLFGDGGKSTAGAYPPLVPVLLYVGQALVGPMLAAKILGIGSLVAVMIAAYVVSRHGMDTWFAVGVATTVGLSATITETVAWGGYPQNYAFAFLTLAALASARYLENGRRQHLLWTAASWSVVALAHHLYFVLSCIVVSLVWISWAIMLPPTRAMVRRTVGLAVATFVACACFGPIFIDMRASGYAPHLNYSELGRWRAFDYAIREAPWLWMIVLFVGLLHVGIGYRHRRSATWNVSAALVLGSLVMVAVTAESRLVSPLIMGASMGVGSVLQRLWIRSRGRAWHPLPLAAATALPTLLWPLTDARTTQVLEYYRVADQSLLNAAAFVDHNHREGLVVARQDQRGWPVGWWFEGLTSAKIAVGGNARWIWFAQERANASLASLFFDHNRTGQQVVELARQEGVDLLVFRKWGWIGWQRWLEEADPVVEVAYDDGEFMVLDVAPR